MGEQPRKLEPLDSYSIPGRGRAWVVIEPDPLLERGELVEIGGSIGRIAAIERYAITPRPGRNVGVLITEWVGHRDATGRIVPNDGDEIASD